MIAVTLKLALETMILASLRHKQHTPLKRTALLLTGELSMVTVQRFFFRLDGFQFLEARIQLVLQ